MTETSILSNLQAAAVRSTLNKALMGTATASSRIGSGKRIVSGADDAAGAALVAGFTSVRQGLEVTMRNAATGKSVASMVDNALQQISNILQRQKALSIQATSGAFSDVERGYLNEEAQQLTQELDRLVSATEFNGIMLLDGSLSGGGTLITNTSGTETHSSAKIQLSAASSTADGTNIFSLNGVQFAVGGSYQYDSTNNEITLNSGDTAAAKATELAAIINNTSANISHSDLSQVMRDRLSGLVATASGDAVTVTSKDAGVGGLFTLSFDAADTDDVTSLQAGITSIAATGKINSSFDAGTTTGSLGVSNVSAVGTMGNSILQDLSQTKATSGWVTVAASDMADGDVVTVSGRSFTIKDTVTNPATHIKRSTTSTLQTLENIATFLNNSSEPGVSNFTYEVRNSSGNAQIKVTSKGASAYHNGVEFTIDTNSFAIDSTSGGSGPASGVSNGLDLSHITDNGGFYGTVSGFQAAMTGSNTVKLTVQIGEYTYQADIANTAPTANSIIRMRSTDINGKGGYFDITLAANQGVAVSTQANANTFASNIDSAIKELTFYQTRQISTFNVEGSSLEQSVATVTAKDFANLEVKDIEVHSSRNSSTQIARISIAMKDGRVFENNTDLGEGVTQGQKINFTNTLNSNENISIIFGRTLDLSDQTTVNTLQKDLLQAFNADKSGMQFQVGLKSTQVISVSIEDMSTQSLFKGNTIDIKTVSGAQAASDAVDIALNTTKSMRATIGAFQSRFIVAAASIEGSKRAVEEAMSVLQDADIAEESTNFAQAEVLSQANIAILSRLNQLPQQLLRLLTSY